MSKSAKIKITEPIKNIICVEFDSRYDLCMSFVRIQEFYESSSNKFRGKYFELEDYMDWWADNFGNGVFNYPQKWAGFNVPGKILYKWFKKFSSGDVNSLRKKEISLLTELFHHLSGKSDFPMEFEKLKDIYLIGVTQGSAKTLNHEIAHGMYSLYPFYRKSCNNLLDSLRKTPEGDLLVGLDTKHLISIGYSNVKKLMDDELQAYYSTSGLLDESIDPKRYSVNGLDQFRNNFAEAKKKIM